MHGLDLSRKTVKGRNGFVGWPLIVVNGVDGYNPNRGHHKAHSSFGNDLD